METCGHLDRSPVPNAGARHLPGLRLFATGARSMEMARPLQASNSCIPGIGSGRTMRSPAHLPRRRPVVSRGRRVPTSQGTRCIPPARDTLRIYHAVLRWLPVPSKSAPPSILRPARWNTSMRSGSGLPQRRDAAVCLCDHGLVHPGSDPSRTPWWVRARNIQLQHPAVSSARCCPSGWMSARSCWAQHVGYDGTRNICATGRIYIWETSWVIHVVGGTRRIEPPSAAELPSSCNRERPPVHLPIATRPSSLRCSGSVCPCENSGRPAPYPHPSPGSGSGFHYSRQCWGNTHDRGSFSCAACRRNGAGIGKEHTHLRAGRSAPLPNVDAVWPEVVGEIRFYRPKPSIVRC